MRSVERFFKRGFQQLADEGLTLPTDGIPSAPTAAEWDAFPWSPAKDKPTWEQLMAACFYGLAARNKATILEALKSECSRRITAAYGMTEWRDEMEMRLRGESTKAQDAERERIRARYATLKARLNAKDIYDFAAESFDATLDSHWED